MRCISTSLLYPPPQDQVQSKLSQHNVSIEKGQTRSASIFPISSKRWNSTSEAIETKEIFKEEAAIITQFGDGLIEDDILNWQETPSVLDTLPKGFTPGQAQYVLDQKGAKKDGRKPIRRTEVWRLCQAARQGHHQDAAVLLTCMRAYKRLHKAVYTDWQARAAIEGMVRALTPVHSSTKEPVTATGKIPRYPMAVDDLDSDEFYLQRIHANLFAVKAILDPSIGLVTAVNSNVVDALLADLLKSVQSLSDLAVIDNLEHPRWKVVRLTQKLVHALIFRHARPERFLKRRAARKYLKQVMRSDPPLPTTIHSACHICILLGTPGDADVGILSEYMIPYIWGVPMEETIQLLDEARAKATKQAQADAALESDLEAASPEETDQEQDKSDEDASLAASQSTLLEQENKDKTS